MASDELKALLAKLDGQESKSFTVERSISEELSTSENIPVKEGRSEIERKPNTTDDMSARDWLAARLRQRQAESLEQSLSESLEHSLSESTQASLSTSESLAEEMIVSEVAFNQTQDFSEVDLGQTQGFEYLSVDEKTSKFDEERSKLQETSVFQPLITNDVTYVNTGDADDDFYFYDEDVTSEKESTEITPNTAEKVEDVPPLVPALSRKPQKNKLWVRLGLGVCGVALIGLISFAVYSHNHSSKKVASPAVSKVSSTSSSSVSKSSESSSSSSSETKAANLSAEDKFKVELDKKALANADGGKYAITVTNIGGGYLLGEIAYEATSKVVAYTDTVLKRPESAQAQADDDKAKELNQTFTNSLPTINDTITVKDGSKVALETYKTDSGYTTVVLYDKKPVAYVTTDNENYSTNHVTTAYISDVAA